MSLLVIVVTLLLSGCASEKINNGNRPGNDGSQPSLSETASPEAASTPQITSSPVPEIDLSVVKPNEAGKIMIVMFHNFVETYKTGDKQFTTTFEEFRKLLGTLYDSGYRLISLKDYLDNNINVPAGFIPMVFTFDDGTSGQFNMVNENGVQAVNSKSAVGIMEEFNREHPDFGLKGTFFVNLGDNTFSGAGALAERLRYLIDKGFEIGNHTYSHINLKKTTDADIVQKEIGGNQKKMYELIPGYKFYAFSLPYGEPSKDLQQYVAKGVFQGVEYENLAIMDVGWDPALSPVNSGFNPLSIHRIRASGITPVEADLAWWLEREKRDALYISDGNPDTVTVPKAREASVDTSKLNGRKLIVY
ncbi:MAG: polysaccharide deacetylase [Ruminiclostridium sp.]|nr:polysaccharide deacetylase [Ruminiclostridium sp.]